MANFSVKAILSAEASGFLSGMSKAENALSKFSNKVSGFASDIKSGILQGVGQQLTNLATDGLHSIVDGLEESSAAWKTFQGNMENFGKNTHEIDSAKKEMKDFATASIYSASDMASTYSQLAAVGIDNCGELVKGFGGLAAAASNPTQAMKTLSQQATQMAAKPKVAWQDFKLMLEQTPAGMAAVAKELGKEGKIAGETTSDLITAVQDGTLATNDFFDAIEKVAGTGTKFNKMATQYKTVGQAMDGLAETVTGVLQPSFDKLSQHGIDALTQLNDAIGSIDGDALADRLDSALQPFLSLADDIGSRFKFAFKSVGSSLKDAFSDTSTAQNFSDMMESIHNAFGSVADFICIHADDIASAIQAMADIIADAVTFVCDNFSNIVDGIGQYIDVVMDVLGPVASQFRDAFKAIGDAITDNTGKFAAASGPVNIFRKVCEKLSGPLSEVAGFLKDNADKIADLLTNVPLLIGAFAGFKILSMVTGNLDKSSGAASGANQSFLNFGKAIALCGAGFLMMAAAATLLANAGAPAIAMFVVMLGSIFALVAVVSVFSEQLQKAAPGLTALGTAVLLCAAGFAIMSAAAIALSTAGTGAIVVFSIMLGAMIALVAVVGTFGSQLSAAAAGLIALGAAVLLCGVGFQIMANAAISLTSAGGAAIAVFFGMIGAIGALVAIIATFSTGLLIAGAGIAIACAGIALMASQSAGLTAIIGAVSDAITAFGDTVSQVLTSVGSLFTDIGSAIQSVCEGIADVINSIGDAVSGVLDSLAGVFDSIGTAALNAGKGIEKTADGIAKLVGLSIADLAATLTAVANGIGDISDNADGMDSVASGMTAISTAAISAKAAVMAISAALTSISAGLGSLGSAGTAAFTLLSAGAQTSAATVTTAMTAMTVSVTAAMTALGPAATSAVTSVTSAFMMLGTVTAMVSTAMNTVRTSAAAGQAAMMILGIAITAAVSQMTILSSIGTMAGQSMISLANGAQTAATGVSSIVMSAQAATSAMAALGSASTSAMVEVSTAFERGGSVSASTMSSAMSEIRSDVQSCASSVSSSASNMMSSFGQAISRGSSKAVSTMTTAMNRIITVTTSGAAKAAVSGRAIGTGFANGVGTAKRAVGIAQSAVGSTISALSGGSSRAYWAGQMIGSGFANGMSSTLGQIRSIAAQMASAANAAIAAKAKIGSPSRVADKLGSWYGEGWYNGISGWTKKSWQAAEGLIAPNKKMQPSLSDAYEYGYGNAAVIEVPLYINGREFARATSDDYAAVQNMRQIRNNRKVGIR